MFDFVTVDVVSRLFVVCLAVLGILVIGELINHVMPKQPEFSRKVVHILVGTFVAFWPWLLTWNEILIMSVAFLCVVIATKHYHWFGAIFGTRQSSWGQIYFAAAVGTVALITQDNWIYMAAILHMSLADGLAAIIGTYFGKNNQYLIFGSVKSCIGTATFFLASLLILFVYFQHANYETAAYLPMLYLVIGATVLENVGLKGLDNLTVPIFVAVVLRGL